MERDVINSPVINPREISLLRFLKRKRHFVFCPLFYGAIDIRSVFTLFFNKIKRNEMGEVRGTWWREGRCIKRFGVGNGRARDNLENLIVDGRIMERRIFKKWKGLMDWIDVAQDRDMKRTVVDVVMNFRFP